MRTPVVNRPLLSQSLIIGVLDSLISSSPDDMMIRLTTKSSLYHDVYCSDEIDMLLTLRQQIAQELAETETLLSSRLDEIMNEKQRDSNGNSEGNADLSGNGVINTVRKTSGLSLYKWQLIYKTRQTSCVTARGVPPAPPDFVSPFCVAIFVSPFSQKKKKKIFKNFSKN